MLDDELKEVEEGRFRFENYLVERLKPYRSWQSYEFFSQHYLALYKQVTCIFVEAIIENRTKISFNRMFLRNCEQFFEAVARSYEQRMLEDFHRTVIIENPEEEIIYE